MKHHYFKISISYFALCSLALIMLIPSSAWAGRKKLMSVRSAKLIAKRGLVESVYGVKLRREDKVIDVVNGIFQATAESKTKGRLMGTTEDEIVYDKEKDIAKVSVSITLENVSALTGIQFPDPSLKITRVGFATSTPESSAPLKAIRVAEIDAYTQLAEEILGFDLESKSKVENYILTSDVIKSKLVAAIFMAELVNYGWEGDDKDAYVTLKINTDTISQILGQGIVSDGIVQVTGYGATVDDYVAPKFVQAPKPTGKKANNEEMQEPKVNQGGVIEKSLDVLPK